MDIQCTKKLLDKLPAAPVQPEAARPLFGWHANLIPLGRRQLLLFLNDATRYPVFLYGARATDFKNLAERFQQALTDVWLADGIDRQTVDRYLELAGPVRITRSTNRSCTANMVRLAVELPFYLEAEDLLAPDQLVQTRLSLRFSDRHESVGADFLRPREALKAELAQLKAVPNNGLSDPGDAPAGGSSPSEPVARDGQTAGKQAQKGKAAAADPAFVFHISLPCGDQQIWRLVAVPARATFAQLHRVIQACFNWQDCHLHQFQIQNEQGNIIAESKTGFDDEELQESRNYERFSERKLLTQYLPACRQLTYTYDFGDDWLHLIEIDRVVDDYDGELPFCLDGAGDAPPEDVGGEPGYEDFLETLRSKASDKAALAEKASLREWAKMQGWQPFDIDVVNRRLKKAGLKRKRLNEG